jgi:hypothetical protein
MEGDPNWVSPADTTGEEDDVIIGPGPVAPKARKKRPLQFEQAFLDALPSAHMYLKLTSFFTIPFCLLPVQTSANCLGIPA